MQTDLIRFPGDLITADLWNRMLALIDSLNGRIDAQEARVVPDVVGDLFPTALDEIVISQLALNTVFDVDGTKGNPDDPALKGRIVIAQMPAPEERVPTGSRVTLLITAQKVVLANAPTVKEVKPEPAQVGKPLDIAGTNFDPNVRVSIRNTQLAANEFNVIGTTQIHIPTVPDFDGAPAPGTTKEIPITVANKAGDGSLPVKFASPETPAARPAVTNVRLLDPTRLRLIGKDLVQSGQVTTVTMGGEDRPFKPQSDGVDILMPGAMAAAFQALPPAVFDLLAKLDARDALLVNI